MLNISLILHQIRSAHNVGAIFRTADAAGVKTVYLVGYTPAPSDRFNQPNREIAKTALGAEEAVAWEARENVLDLITELKTKNFQIVALEQHEESIDYKKFDRPADGSNLALILGNEVGGIEPETLANCDRIIEIPMRGKKESLNVSVAAGVAIFRLLDR